MKDTPAFLLLLHLPLLLLLMLVVVVPGECLGRAHDRQCSSAFQTVDYEYRSITTAYRPMYDQINTTMYVRPQQDLSIVLEVDGSDDKYYATKLVLERDCFKGDWMWWELWVKVKCVNSYIKYSGVWTEYKLQVRTSQCVKMCTRYVNNKQGLVSLHVLAYGASQWRLDQPGRQCGPVPQWKEGSQLYIPTCTDANLSSLLTTKSTKSTTTPATATTTPATPTTIRATPTTTPATTTPSLHPDPPCKSLSSVPVGATEGVVAAIVVMLVVLVVVVVVVVVLHRRGKAAVKDVLPMRPQRTQ